MGITRSDTDALVKIQTRIADVFESVLSRPRFKAKVIRINKGKIRFVLNEDDYDVQIDVLNFSTYIRVIYYNKLFFRSEFATHHLPNLRKLAITLANKATQRVIHEIHSS